MNTIVATLEKGGALAGLEYDVQTQALDRPTLGRIAGVSDAK